MGSVLRRARESRNAPSRSARIESASARGSGAPAAARSRSSAASQLSNTSAVARRSVSWVLATSPATVAIGHASA